MTEIERPQRPDFAFSAQDVADRLVLLLDEKLSLPEPIRKYCYWPENALLGNCMETPHGPAMLTEQVHAGPMPAHDESALEKMADYLVAGISSVIASVPNLFALVHGRLRLPESTTIEVGQAQCGLSGFLIRCIAAYDIHTDCWTYRADSVFGFLPDQRTANWKSAA